MRIVVSCPNWIGDAVMATPALAALRRAYPRAHLALVVRPYVAPVLEPAPYADEVLRWGEPGGLTTGELVRQLRRERYDAGVLLTNSLRSALLFFMAGVRRRIGYAREGRGLLLTERLQPQKEHGRFVPVPMVSYYFDLVRLLGAHDSSVALELYTTLHDENEADGIYGMLGLKAPQTLIMAPGAAFGLAKCWPPARFAEIARRARQELGLRTLVLCSRQEQPVAQQIVEASDGAAVAPGERAPALGTVKAVVRRARAVVTNDSGLRHFAAAFDVPVVTIFGPTHINWTETWFLKETKLQAAVACGPCQKRVCPEGHLQCMMEVTPEQVFGALAAAVAKFPYQPPRPETIIPLRISGQPVAV